jgi:putative tricarboxylic transport membrane protein
VLAFVLGPLFEQAVRRSLIISQGDPSIFVTRPWAVVFLILTVFIVVGPIVREKRTQSEAQRKEDDGEDVDEGSGGAQTEKALVDDKRER